MKASHSRFAKALAAMSIAVILIFGVGCGGSGGGSAAGGSSSTLKGSAEKGQEVYKSAKMGCSSCHKINGQGGAVGPDLSHIATTAAQRKAGTSAEDYIKESIKNPSAFTVEGYQNIMPKLNPSDQELADLVAYFMTLK